MNIKKRQGGENRQMRIETRINKIEEMTGIKRRGPDKVIFEVIGETGQVMRTIEIAIRQENHKETFGNG